MIEKAIQNYYIFFDETLESTTFIVLIITLLIFIVGTFVPSANAHAHLKADILNQHTVESFTNTVVIDGIEYQLEFSRIN